MKSLLILIICLAISGCTKVIFATANAPKVAFDGEIIHDIAYGSGQEQTLDIYVPESAKQGSLPVVVFFHGGRWTFGNKQQYAFVGISLAKLGYIAVLPNTRLYPEVKFPTFVDDGAAAVAWVYKNIEQYGGNQNLFISGHSSGAHIGALIVANDEYLSAEGLSNQIINAFAGMAGPYDFEPKAKDLKDMFGPPSNYPNMAVTTFIEGNEPPMLLLYSKDDDTVHIRNLQKLRSKIQSENGIVKTIMYETGEHTGTVAAFSWANPSDLPVERDIDQFFNQYMND